MRLTRDLWKIKAANMSTQLQLKKASNIQATGGCATMAQDLALNAPFRNEWVNPFLILCFFSAEVYGCCREMCMFWCVRRRLLGQIPPQGKTLGVNCSGSMGEKFLWNIHQVNNLMVLFSATLFCKAWSYWLCCFSQIISTFVSSERYLKPEWIDRTAIKLDLSGCIV